MRRSIWAPVLDGALAARAIEAVEAIALDPRVRSSAAPEGAGGADPAALASLAGGNAGRALLYAYLAEWHDGDDARVALDLLESSTGALECVAMSASLHAGFPGIVWVHAHLAGRLFDIDEQDTDPVINEALTGYLARTPWPDDYDLIGGLVGLGAYALEQRAPATTAAMLRQILDRLTELAERSERGATWFTPSTLLGPVASAQCPSGCYNLGLAHGVPGVVALLGYMCASGLDARPLLGEAVAWLLGQELPAGAQSAFAFWLGIETPPRPARLAWCYGDAGVATALLIAARGAGRADWERDALRIARKASERSVESSGVRDAGLCHGAAGLGHIFNRLYQATGEPWLADAARAWFERTLDLRRPDDGVAGFMAANSHPDGREHWEADTSLLTGAAGIALALLAASTPVEPAWDRVLLTAIP